MPVFVAKDSGGKLEATLCPSSAATALTALVMLVEDFPCIGFGGLYAAKAGPNAGRDLA